mmetsp:Transcript_91155/g.162288  ORF Transcript_91155/g.162288 Transcript_91155/m.162288 type:complete len:191 (-) Transcript_91155:150-722(-)
MGAVQSTTHEALSSISPWSAVVHVKNCTSTPVTALLAHNAEIPSHHGATFYEVPPLDTVGIVSGYLHEPRATLIIRTGVDEAKIFRVPHAGRLLIEVAEHGLKVQTTDRVEVSAYGEPHAVPGHITIPMAMRGESFEDPEDTGHLLGRLHSGAVSEVTKEKDLPSAAREVATAHHHRKPERLAAPEGLEQ